jgi:hypothetical protein
MVWGGGVVVGFFQTSSQPEVFVSEAGCLPPLVVLGARGVGLGGAGGQGYGVGLVEDFCGGVT